MNAKGAMFLGVCLIVAALIVTLVPRSVGRYQLGGVPGHAYVLDTVTGRVWEKFASPTEGISHKNFDEPK